MAYSAIYLKNGSLFKTNNIEKKLKKETDSIEILEKWEYDNDLKRIDERFNYWNNLMNKKEDPTIESSKLYHFINPKTGYTVTSIYPNLESYIKDWQEYERQN